MNLPENLYGALLRMTYATQFSNPMSAGVERTLAAIVWPLLFKFQPEQYLREIADLLEGNYILNTQEFTERRTNSEVKLYLKELSTAIEREFPTVAQSGSVIKVAGSWKCVSCTDEVERSFEFGDILPGYHGRTCTWKFKPTQVPQSAIDALTEELCTYYTKKSMRNSFSLSDPEEHVIETSNRLVSSLPDRHRTELIDVLLQLQSSPDDPYFTILKERSGVDWPGNKDSWIFFKQFCSILASQVSDSIR